MKIAVYGSLKNGFYNHNRFNIGNMIGKSKIRGAMFLCGSYPHLFREGICNSSLYRDHEVEIYDVSDEVYQAIKQMELGAGYQEVEMSLKDEAGSDHDVVVFYSKDNLSYDLNWIKNYSPKTAPMAVT